MTIELFPLNSSATIKHNTGRGGADRAGHPQRRRPASPRAGALAVETGAHTGRSAQDKFIVRDATTEKAVWWDNNKPMTPEQFDLLLCGLPRARQVARAVRAGPVRRRRSCAPAECAHLRRVCLARAVHPPPAAPAGGQRAGRLQAAVHRRQPAELPRRPQAARRAHRDGDRLQLRQAPGADRRHVLRRRDQEIGLHLPQLRDARDAA